jgi:hypothetical protein
MITVKLALGNSVLSGLTFSSEEQVEEIEAYIGIIGTNSEIAHLLKRSRTDQQGVYANMSEEVAGDLTFSLILTPDTPEDIDYVQGTYAGLKNIVVELV